MQKYRITFSPNGLNPFIWMGLQGITSYEKAAERFNLLAQFDLGNVDDSTIKAQHGDEMIKRYKAYRRSHGINHSSMIAFSSGTIEQWDEESQEWWIVSESGDELPDYEIGEMSAYSEI